LRRGEMRGRRRRRRRRGQLHLSKTPYARPPSRGGRREGRRRRMATCWS